MRTIFFGTDSDVFTPGSAAYARSLAYAQRVGEVHLISCAPLKAKEIHEGNFHAYPVWAPWILASLALRRCGQKLAATVRPGLVIADDPFECGWAASAVARTVHAPLYIHVRTDYLSPWFVRDGIYRSPRVRMPFMNRIRIRMADRVLPRAQGIRTVSERVRESLIVRFGSRIVPPVVIPRSVSADISPIAELPPRAFTFTLVAIGHLIPENRMQDIVAAVKRLTDAYPALGACIIGEGSERRRLTKMIRSLGLDDKVLLLGCQADAWSIAQSAQAFIQTSAYKGYGRGLVKAALMHLPIVTTDVGIVGEAFQGYEHVLSAPVGDPTNVAAHIAWLIEDPQARKMLCTVAYEKAIAIRKDFDEVMELAVQHEEHVAAGTLRA